MWDRWCNWPQQWKSRPKQSSQAWQSACRPAAAAASPPLRRRQPDRPGNTTPVDRRNALHRRCCRCRDCRFRTNGAREHPNYVDCRYGHCPSCTGRKPPQWSLRMPNPGIYAERFPVSSVGSLPADITGWAWDLSRLCSHPCKTDFAGPARPSYSPRALHMDLCLKASSPARNWMWRLAGTGYCPCSAHN